MTDLAKAIKEARGARTREEFCVFVGCGMATLVRWEHGTTRPRSAAHKRRLSKAGVPAHLMREPASQTLPAGGEAA